MNIRILRSLRRVAIVAVIYLMACAALAAWVAPVSKYSFAMLMLLYAEHWGLYALGLGGIAAILAVVTEPKQALPWGPRRRRRSADPVFDGPKVSMGTRGEMIRNGYDSSGRPWGS